MCESQRNYIYNPQKLYNSIIAIFNFKSISCSILGEEIVFIIYMLYNMLCYILENLNVILCSIKKHVNARNKIKEANFFLLSLY